MENFDETLQQLTEESKYDLCVARIVGYLTEKIEYNNLVLSELDINDKSHLCLLEIAKAFCPIMNINVSVEMGKLRYFFNKKKLGVDRAKTTLDSTVINVEEFLNGIAMRDTIICDPVLARVYEAFYAPLSEKEEKEIKKALKKEKKNGN